MSATEDRPEPVSPERSLSSVVGSTAPLMAAIVAVSALGSFGAVRAFAPRRPATVATAPRVAHDAAASAARDVALPTDGAPPMSGAQLSVITDPPGARVEIDGQPRGAAPVVIEGLAPSQHRIAVKSDTGTAQRTVTVRNGVVTEVVFSLPRPASPASAAAPVAGWVAVNAPFAVDVVERGDVVGTSGTKKIMLAAGKHELLLRNAEVGFEATRAVDIAPGRVVSLAIDPPKAVLNVNARPWADVLIDGHSVGQTPLSNVALPVGPHQITFRHPQFGERTERVVVTARGVNRASVDFNK